MKTNSNLRSTRPAGRARRLPRMLAVILLLGLTFPRLTPAMAEAFRPPQPPMMQPSIGAAVTPVEIYMPAQSAEPPEEAVILPLRPTAGEPGGPADPQFMDPVAQQAFGAGKMPAPLKNFAGMSFAAGEGGLAWPPDPNGDVGPNYYMQAVNISIAIYDKSSGARLRLLSYNDFFDGTGTPCDNSNRGDPVAIYDRLAGRWLVSDFAWVGGVGPFYECVAVSKTADPLGSWWMYAFKVSDTVLNDYPKVGVWPDGYYFTFNMYRQPGDTWEGVQVWALNRAQMLVGAPAQTVSFALSADSGYASLLPSNALSASPAGTPNYILSVAPPGNVQVWNFHVDWTTPANSTFTGPSLVPVAAFSAPVDPPQPGTTRTLDSVGFRPMMHLNYRSVNGIPALWLNHTVLSQGVDGVRWYELRPQAGQMTLAQQGTYQPDSHHRWMGSAAVDKDGNLAIGYSVSGSDLYPSIRYAGRLGGETPGLLPQSENSLIEGTGAQITTNRWGDYSSMMVDPSDDCTFWYTNEYLAASGSNWLTRIGAFKFPSCGQPKATLTGTVRNAVTLAPVAGAQVVAASPALTLTGVTDAAGVYHLTAIAGTYVLTAGPHLPGYPIPAVAGPVSVAAGGTASTDILLAPVPHLAPAGSSVDDAAPPAQANANGYAEPGEQGLRLFVALENTGALTSTQVTARLSSLTPGVTVTQPNSAYPDIPPGSAPISNTVPFVFSISSQIACGSDLQFREVVTDSQKVYTLTLSLNASVPLPRTNLLFNDVEHGAAGWQAENPWGITAAEAHSPSHSWTDSPAGSYANYADTSLRSPALDLSGKRGVQVSGWARYALEPGYDYVYLEYSLNNGATWSQSPAEALLAFNGVQPQWQAFTAPAPVLDGQGSAAVRFRLKSDAGVTADGIYLDDLAVSYAPYYCNYPPAPLPAAPQPVSPAEGSHVQSPVTFTWQAGAGGAPVGYVLTIDSATQITVTAPTTRTTVLLSPGAHTWMVTAFNWSGTSPASPLRNFIVDEPIYLPFLSLRRGG